MGSNLVTLLGAVLSGTVLRDVGRFLWRRVRRDPKSVAEARKLNAEASHVEWQTLRDEIDRLTKTVRAQGRCIGELKAAAEKRDDRETALENDNRHLRTQVGRLRRRVEGLEKILKVEPITPEQQRLLDALPDDAADADEPKDVE